MYILIMLLVGALAGFLASLVMGTDGRMGWVANIVVGVLGSILGSMIYSLLTTGRLVFTTAYLTLSVTGILVSTLGAIALIAILKFFRKDSVL